MNRVAVETDKYATEWFLVPEEGVVPQGLVDGT